MLSHEDRSSLLAEVRALHLRGAGLTDDLIERIVAATDPGRSLAAAADALDTPERVWSGHRGVFVMFEPTMLRQLPLSVWLRLRAEHGEATDAWAQANLCGIQGCTLAYGHGASLDARDHSYLPDRYRQLQESE